MGQAGQAGQAGQGRQAGQAGQVGQVGKWGKWSKRGSGARGAKQASGASGTGRSPSPIPDALNQPPQEHPYQCAHVTEFNVVPEADIGGREFRMFLPRSSSNSAM